MPAPDSSRRARFGENLTLLVSASHLISCLHLASSIVTVLAHISALAPSPLLLCAEASVLRPVHRLLHSPPTASHPVAALLCHIFFDTRPSILPAPKAETSLVLSIARRAPGFTVITRPALSRLPRRDSQPGHLPKTPHPPL
jgi:hypothetical protein